MDRSICRNVKGESLSEARNKLQDTTQEVAVHIWINNSLRGRAAGRTLWKNSFGTLGIEKKSTENKCLLHTSFF